VIASDKRYGEGGVLRQHAKLFSFPSVAPFLYAELHCKTNFSFLEGASHPDELVAHAAELGYRALAVTDRASLAGIVRAHMAAKDCGLKLIVGAELHPVDAPPVVLWATDRNSYGRLSRLITVGRRNAEKGECRLTFDDIAQHSEGLLAGVVGPGLGDRSQETGDRNRRRSLDRVSSNLKTEIASLESYLDVFGDRVYLLAELFRGPDDAARLEQLARLSRQSGVPLVAAGDVHYHTAARMPLHDVLTCIRHGATLATAEGLLHPNAQRHLKPIDVIRRAFSAAPGAVRRTLEIADRCQFSLDDLRYEYPVELAPHGHTPMSYLRYLANKGVNRRYPEGVPEKVRGLLEHELQLIDNLRYEAFFLTVWDAVRFARSRGILCQGRGSAANSVVCYCLGITSVDPARTDVLFERFISRERNEAPDIDVDFEHERREEVLQYLYNKYGRDRAGLAATVITYRSRSAVRDVGKALGFSLDCVDSLAKQVEGYTHEPKLAQRMQEAGIDAESDLGRKFMHLVNELLGFPRHLSQHVGGMVITQGPLCELAPIENAAMPDRTVIQWDKDDLEELGILKVDCLCLGMLTAIRKALEMIEHTYGRRLTLATVPPEDDRVYDMICQADTMGVFQIESRAQMSMLPRLRPRCYYDLVIEVAIVRPGPIQGQMVHPYLRRRNGESEPQYPNDEIRDVLKKTLGVPLFQEQAMRLAVVAAGFTPGEADQLRRAMAAWRRPGVIDQFRQKMFEGMHARGLPDDFAELVFTQIRGFGEYGFPESHAASFALLVYVSAWIKFYYPEVFCAALLNSQPMGFYAPSQLIRDAREHGVRVLPVDVNFSEWDCALEETGVRRQRSAVRNQESEVRSRKSEVGDPVIGFRIPNPAPRSSNPESPTPIAKHVLRLGMRLITGFAERHARAIVRARADGPFRSVADFTERAGLGRAVIAQLAEADALASLEGDRRAALWESLAQERMPQDRPLLAMQDDDEPPTLLPQMSSMDQVLADYRTSGFSLKAHPLSFFRRQLAARRVLPARMLAEAPADRQVCVAGLVILRQRPSTANGITFVTLEDETGVANLVVRQAVWERFYTVARRSPAWIAHGKLERRDAVIHVVVNRLEDLSSTIGDWNVRSRDFR
jgi:error-prone DNA polymerase